MRTSSSFGNGAAAGEAGRGNGAGSSNPRSCGLAGSRSGPNGLLWPCGCTGRAVGEGLVVRGHLFSSTSMGFFKFYPQIFSFYRLDRHVSFHVPSHKLNNIPKLLF